MRNQQGVLPGLASRPVTLMAGRPAVAKGPKRARSLISGVHLAISGNVFLCELLMPEAHEIIDQFDFIVEDFSCPGILEQIV